MIRARLTASPNLFRRLSNARRLVNAFTAEALNDTANKLAEELIDESFRRFALPISDIRDAVRVEEASVANLRASIIVDGRAVRLTRFPHVYIPGEGVRVQVYRGQFFTIPDGRIGRSDGEVIAYRNGIRQFLYHPGITVLAREIFDEKKEDAPREAAEELCQRIALVLR